MNRWQLIFGAAVMIGMGIYSAQPARAAFSSGGLVLLWIALSIKWR